MADKVIAKSDLNAWLKSLSEKWDVVAPVTESGVTRYRPIDDPSKIDLKNQPNSLREQFTPETETLFAYQISGKEAELTLADAVQKDRLIFGARACDAAGLKYVDAVYSMVQPVDVPYFDRRARTTIIGIFCDQPWWSCFCTELNGFLTDPIELDAAFTDIGDKYFVQAFTPKGEALMGASQFQAATDADLKALETVREKALGKLPKKANHEEACLSYDWEAPIWAKLPEKCLGCGICNYSCPTCHCFDIQECKEGMKGSRFRCWDTCQFEKFTLMGHGHNPRPSKKERTRQRVFHKFKYSVERYGMLGCVGCGRCISLCPVNIDIHRVVNELEKETPVEAKA